MGLRREFMLYCPTYNGYWYAGMAYGGKFKNRFVKPELTEQGFIVNLYTPYTLEGVLKKGVELGKKGYKLEVHLVEDCMDVPELTMELNRRIKIAEKKMFDEILKNRNR